MKLHGTKLLWAGGLVLILSAAGFGRLSNSLDNSAAQPQLATLGSLYKSANPYALTTAATETEAGKAPGAAEQTAADTRIRTDFSPYVLLHVTRADNLVTHDDID